MDLALAGSQTEPREVCRHHTSTGPRLDTEIGHGAPHSTLQPELPGSLEPNAWSSHVYEKGSYLADLSDEVIAVLTSHVPRKSSPLSVLIFYRLDSAYAEVSDEATAFSGPRTPCYFGNLVALCPAPELLPAERQWIRELHADLQPHTIYGGSYVNVTPEPDLAGIHDVYGSKFARLQAIKATYDPRNVFHRNANIPPARPEPAAS